MSKILIVYHSLSGNTKKMATAVAEGARRVNGTEVVVKKGMEAGVDDLLACDGIAIGSPDYFSYVAGGIKDFFDRVFYPTQGKVTGKPCVTFGSAGGPAKVVLDCLDGLCFEAMKFKRAAEPVGASGSISPQILEECTALGKAFAEELR